MPVEPPDLPYSPQKTYRVLLTGFGPQPFSHHKVNPSWLAVQALHDAVITSDETDIMLDNINKNPNTTNTSIPNIHRTTNRSTVNASSASSSSIMPPLPTSPYTIHVSSLQIPVLYEAVLSTVPGLHLKPPKLPPSTPPDFPPPPEPGYDFIFHVGLAGRGSLRMEILGHKFGYNMKDASGSYCSIAQPTSKQKASRAAAQAGGVGEAGVGPAVGIGIGSDIMVPMISSTDVMQRAKLGYNPVVHDPQPLPIPGSENTIRPLRGFGEAYESFPDEIMTDIDVTRLMQDLKSSGMEIYTSMDAGHHVCDFMYYCSLAEAKRSAKFHSDPSRNKHAQVLFLHCPPVGEPLSTEEVTEAVRRIVMLVCRELRIEEGKATPVGDAQLPA